MIDRGSCAAENERWLNSTTRSVSDQASLTVLAEQSTTLTVSPRGLPNMDGRELCKLFTPSVRR